MFTNLINEAESLSAEEQQAILDTEYPAELQKEAEAQLDAAQLVDGLYAYGAMKAERAVAEEEGIDKVAAEAVQAHDEALEELATDIDALIETSGVADSKDEVEFHKEAQAAASIIARGYFDTLEKIAAAKPKAVAGMLGKAREAASATGAHLSKHKKKYLGGAAAGAAAGGAAYGLMKKKASDATLGDIVDALSARDEASAAWDEVNAGVEKLAADGAGMGKRISEAASKAWKATKDSKVGTHVGKHGKKYSAGAGLLAGAAAGRASK